MAKSNANNTNIVTLADGINNANGQALSGEVLPKTPELTKAEKKEQAKVNAEIKRLESFQFKLSENESVSIRIVNEFGVNLAEFDSIQKRQADLRTKMNNLITSLLTLKVKMGEVPMCPIAVNLRLTLLKHGVAMVTATNYLSLIRWALANGTELKSMNVSRNKIMLESEIAKGKGKSEESDRVLSPKECEEKLMGVLKPAFNLMEGTYFRDLCAVISEELALGEYNTIHEGFVAAMIRHDNMIDTSNGGCVARKPKVK